MTGMRLPTALDAHGRGQLDTNLRAFDGGYMSKLAMRDSVDVSVRDSGGVVTSTNEVGELLYTVTLNITGIKEYGVSFAALMAGEPTPIEGARFDVPFEGTAAGPKVNGAAEGIDYVRVRADGRFELHIHESITTEDGQSISAHGDGMATLRPEGGIADVRVNMTLFASSKEYTWVNQRPVKGIGTIDLAKRVIRVAAYSA